MILRNYVTFTASCSDDAVWDENGNIRVPGGQNVSELLQIRLRKSGYTCTNAVRHHFYGWSFEVAGARGTVWCLVQSGGMGPESWLLICEPRSPGRLFKWRRLSALADVVKALDQNFKDDERISDVLWYTRDEYESIQRDGGTPMPT